jgi:hypothetical protein
MGARVAFRSRVNGARLDGEFIADTGVAWLVKPDGNYPVYTVQRNEWDSVEPAPARGHRTSAFDDLFRGQWNA